jgi:hypothetical protein
MTGFRCFDIDKSMAHDLLDHIASYPESQAPSGL